MLKGQSSPQVVPTSWFTRGKMSYAYERYIAYQNSEETCQGIQKKKFVLKKILFKLLRN